MLGFPLVGLGVGAFVWGLSGYNGVRVSLRVGCLGLRLCGIFWVPWALGFP